MTRQGKRQVKGKTEVGTHRDHACTVLRRPQNRQALRSFRQALSTDNSQDRVSNYAIIAFVEARSQGRRGKKA
jgi:hypothetical protein